MMGNSQSSTTGEHTMTMEKGSRTLTVQQEKGAGTADIAFSIRENNQIFTDYGISHTKEMHFIVVRDDLLHFQHVHPVRDAKGVWHVDAKPATEGAYWFYADFADKDGGSYALRFEKTFTGDKGSYGIVKDFSVSKTVDGYRITLKPSLSGNTATFTYDVADANGQPVQLEDYLGAKGHSILLTTEGGFIHAHAEDVPPVFTTDVDPGTFYRMYTQFQIKGKVITVSFDWQS